ncbi:basic proline-rich protein-like [Panthera tigris]|uniref:basic proline-rich protein-like n=1 Tax=Panthera tigris TaxID=9694 RepID=UPI001C6FC32E|nr:basic proline-rich protein-like [Panthera tigris]
MDPFPGAKTRSPRERRCQRVTSGGGACAIYGSGRPSPRPSPPPPPPPPPPRSLTDCLTAPRAGPSPASPASPAATERHRAPPPPPPAALRGSSRPPAAREVPARSAPGLSGDPEPGVRLRALRRSQTSPAPASLKAERTPRAPGSCPQCRRARSQGLHCCVVQGQESERRAGASLKSHPETWAKSGSQGCGVAGTARPHVLRVWGVTLSLRWLPGRRPHSGPGVRTRRCAQAKPGAGNKARAVSAAPTPSLARNVRPKCPVPRETADAPRNSLDPLPGNPRALQGELQVRRPALRARPAPPPAPPPARAPGAARLPSLAWGQGAIYGRRRGSGSPPGARCSSRRPRSPRAGSARPATYRNYATLPSPPAPVRASPAPRALGPRSPPRGPARRGAGGPPPPTPDPPEPERPPGQRSPAARTLPGRGAKVHCEARPAAPPEVPGSRVPNAAARLRRSPARAPRRPGERTPAAGGAPGAARPPCAQRPARGAPSSTFVAGGLWGPQAGAGSPRRGRERTPRAYLRRSFDGRRGAPWPRGGGGASGRPGGCAARRLPTFPPPTLPGEPTGRAASAPVRTRRAAFHRGRRRRGGRGPGGGARRCPQAAPRPAPAAVPPARRPCGGTSGASPGPGAEPPRGGLPQAPEPRSFLQGPKALATPGRRERAKLGEEAPRLRHLSEACPRPWAGPKPSV